MFVMRVPVLREIYAHVGTVDSRELMRSSALFTGTYFPHIGGSDFELTIYFILTLELRFWFFFPFSLKLKNISYLSLVHWNMDKSWSE